MTHPTQVLSSSVYRHELLCSSMPPHSELVVCRHSKRCVALYMEDGYSRSLYPKHVSVHMFGGHSGISPTIETYSFTYDISKCKVHAQATVCRYSNLTPSPRVWAKFMSSAENDW